MNPGDDQTEDQTPPEEIGHLIVKIKESDKITIGPNITIRVNRIIGGKAYLSIMAPLSAKINRTHKP